jgi:hypothetical protein
MNNRREDFERFISTHWRYIEFEIKWYSYAEEYSEQEVQDAWDAWNAALDSRVVELPPFIIDEYEDGAVEYCELQPLLDALEKAGIKYK